MELRQVPKNLALGAFSSSLVTSHFVRLGVKILNKTTDSWCLFFRPVLVVWPSLNNLYFRNCPTRSWPRQYI